MVLLQLLLLLLLLLLFMFVLVVTVCGWVVVVVVLTYAPRSRWSIDHQRPPATALCSGLLWLFRWRWWWWWWWCVLFCTFVLPSLHAIAENTSKQ